MPSNTSSKKELIEVTIDKVWKEINAPILAYYDKLVTVCKDDIIIKIKLPEQPELTYEHWLTRWEQIWYKRWWKDAKKEQSDYELLEKIEQLIEKYKFVLDKKCIDNMCLFNVYELLEDFRYLLNNK